jgi:hypothetical protein
MAGELETIPPLPQGFTVDTAQPLPPLPAGFALNEAPAVSTVAADVGREAVKGAGGTVDFMTGLVGSNLSAAMDIPAEQRKNMSAADFDKLPRSRVIPAIDTGKNPGDLMYRENQYGEKLEGLMTGANLAGATIVPFGAVRKVKQGVDLARNALLFGTGAGAFDAATEDTSEIGKVGAGLTTLFGAGGFKNLVKSGNLWRNTSTPDDAATLINNIAFDPEAAQAAVKAAVARGEKGTVGQITKDPYILSLESGAARDSKFAQELAVVNKQIAAGAVADVAAVAPAGANPASMLKQTMARVEEGKGNIAARTDRMLTGVDTQIAKKENVLAKALAQQETAVSGQVAAKENVLSKALAQQETKTLADAEAFNLATLNKGNPTGAPPITKIGRDGVTQQFENFTTEYGKVWDKVDSVPMNSWLATKATAERGVKTLSTDTAKSTVKNLAKNIRDVAAAPTKQSVKSLDTTLRNAAETAQSGATPDKALYEVIKDMRQSLRAGFDPAITKRLSEIDASYGNYLTTSRAAKAAADKGGVYTPEQLNKADVAIAGELRFNTNRGFMQEATDPALGTVKTTADTTKALEAAAKDSIKATEKTGRETTAALQDAGGASINESKALAKALRNTGVKRTKAIKEKSYAGQFAAHDDAVQAVDKVLANTTNPIRQTEELIRVANKDKSGKALDGLKAAYIQSLSKRISTSGELAGSAADKFASLKGPLGKMFSTKEMGSLEQAIKSSQKIKLHSSVKAANLPEAGKGLKFYAASILGIKAATSLLSGNALLMGRVGREAAVEAAVGTPHKKLLKAMEDMLINPAKYADSIAKVKAAPTEKNLSEALVEWGVRASAANQEDN